MHLEVSTKSCHEIASSIFHQNSFQKFFITECSTTWFKTLTLLKRSEWQRHLRSFKRTKTLLAYYNWCSMTNHVLKMLATIRFDFSLMCFDVWWNGIANNLSRSVSVTLMTNDSFVAGIYLEMVFDVNSCQCIVNENSLILRSMPKRTCGSRRINKRQKIR